jgi:DNA-3-methyladenine glycosylase
VVLHHLTRDFFAADAPDVAPLVLNKLLVVGECVGRVTEVEAYTRDDPASHSFRGRTNRNAVMFGEAGHLYVYFTYGMHHCANVVTGDDGDGQAVLIRAVEPLIGTDDMIRRRGRRTNIADGPGKLCQAFGIDLDLNGADLCSGPRTCILDDDVAPPEAPIVTTRIGIRVGTERLWRWSVGGSSVAP